MFLTRNDGPKTSPAGHEDSAELQKMLTSCMINRQILVRYCAIVPWLWLVWLCV